MKKAMLIIIVFYSFALNTNAQEKSETNTIPNPVAYYLDGQNFAVFAVGNFEKCSIAIVVYPWEVIFSKEYYNSQLEEKFTLPPGKYSLCVYTNKNGRFYPFKDSFIVKE